MMIKWRLFLKLETLEEEEPRQAFSESYLPECRFFSQNFSKKQSQVVVGAWDLEQEI